MTQVQIAEAEGATGIVNTERAMNAWIIGINKEEGGRFSSRVCQCQSQAELNAARSRKESDTFLLNIDLNPPENKVFQNELGKPKFMVEIDTPFWIQQDSDLGPKIHGAGTHFHDNSARGFLLVQVPLVKGPSPCGKPMWLASLELAAQAMGNFEQSLDGTVIEHVMCIIGLNPPEHLYSFLRFQGRGCVRPLYTYPSVL